MGTSSSYNAPTDGRWTQAKTIANHFGRQAGADGQSTYPRDLSGAYLGAVGGVVGAVARAVAARTTASGFAGFVTAVGTGGLSRALQTYGLDALLGRPAPEVLAALVDQFAGDGALLEEAAARDALAEVLGQVFADAETFEELDALLGEVDASRLRELIQRFFSRYVYLRLLQELLASIERGARSIEQAERARRELEEFVTASVIITFVDLDPLQVDWAGPEGQQIVNQWLQDAYAGLEK